MSICTDCTGPGHKVAVKVPTKKQRTVEKRARRASLSPEQLAERQTGTLKPPRKVEPFYTEADYLKLIEKAEELSYKDGRNVILYTDERNTISMRSVRNSDTIFQSRNLLKVIRYEDVKIKMEARRNVKGKRKKVR